MTSVFWSTFIAKNLVVLAGAEAAGRYLTRRTRPNVPVPEREVYKTNVDEVETARRIRTEGASEFKILEPKGTVKVFLFIVQNFSRCWWFSSSKYRCGWWKG